MLKANWRAHWDWKPFIFVAYIVWISFLLGYGIALGVGYETPLLGDILWGVGLFLYIGFFKSIQEYLDQLVF